MSFGMTAEQYWDGDPWLAKAYRDTQNILTERMNREAHLYGFYVYGAISVALSNFVAKRGTKQQNYIEPLRITPMTEAERVLEERKKVIEHFNRFEEVFNARKGGRLR